MIDKKTIKKSLIIVLLIVIIIVAIVQIGRTLARYESTATSTGDCDGISEQKLFPINGGVMASNNILSTEHHNVNFHKFPKMFIFIQACIIVHNYPIYQIWVFILILKI